MAMIRTLILALAAMLVQARIRPVNCTNEVFAHLIIGNTYSYTQQDFSDNIQAASDAGIDGFALDIATPAIAAHTNQSLDYVYAAAESFSKPFKLFLSFDYGAVPDWDPSLVIEYINTYKTSSAQFYYNGKPFVSTFEGPSHASDWTNIKSQTNAFFIPDYSSLGAAAAASTVNVDGLLSWDAWPNYTADVPTTDQEVSVLDFAFVALTKSSRAVHYSIERKAIHDARQPVVLHQHS